MILVLNLTWMDLSCCNVQKINQYFFINAQSKKLWDYFYEVEYSSPVKKKVLCIVFFLSAYDFRPRFDLQIRLILHAFISKHNALMFVSLKEHIISN